MCFTPAATAALIALMCWPTRVPTRAVLMSSIFVPPSNPGEENKRKLVDVRSPDEFSGKKTHMPEYPQEGVLRGGHIPGARSVPWAKAANPDGSFKSADELRTIYEKEQGLKPNDDIIAYCRIGERSSHTWFVLTYLLGYDKVRNYDGSWTEWGNSVRVPIETGPGGNV